MRFRGNEEAWAGLFILVMLLLGVPLWALLGWGQ